ncbi:hypothetical protein ANRL1_02172 [Anaerolineae bacterium]|nr:hypothetical protein ANRL1_02172 [Anaerolineae bacterium]
MQRRGAFSPPSTTCGAVACRSCQTLDHMKPLLQTLGASLVVLIGADQLYTAANNRYVQHVGESLEESTSWLATSVGLEAAALVLCLLSFALAGAALVLLLPRNAHQVRIAFFVGAAYSAALYLFLPYLPLVRYDRPSWWLVLVASFPYVVPGLATSFGAWATLHLRPSSR